MSASHSTDQSQEAQETASTILHDIVTYMGRPKEVDAITLKIGCLSWDGLWSFEVSKSTRIYRLKVMALRELYNEAYNSQIHAHLLKCPAKKRALSDNNTINQEYLKDGDVLELVNCPAITDVFIHFPRRITDEVVSKATAHLPQPQERPFISNIITEIQAPEFKCDIRKIMVTLIEHSLRLMSLKPNAKHIFNVVRRKLFCENFYVDSKMLDKYTTTGASVRRLKFAINASYNDEYAVTQWLEETKSVDSEHLNITTFVDDISIEDQLAGLLNLLHQYLRCAFQLCPKAMDILMEMGFNFDEVCSALRYTGNNIAESVIYLLGYTDPNNDGAKRGLDTPLSPTSDLYKEIMTDPEIVLPLYNPSVLYACLSVLDSSSFFVSSMRIPLVTGILNKIVTNYYSIRCVMAINQMRGIMPNE